MGKKSIKWLHVIKKLDQSWLWMGSALLFLGIIFFFVTFSNVQSQTYDIEKFSVAQETIRSPITMENRKETERKVREAVQAVEDQYSISREITEERVGYLKEIFAAIDKVESDETKKQLEQQSDSNLKPITQSEKLQALQHLLSYNITEKVDPNVLVAIMEATPYERSLAKEFIITSVYEEMNKGVKSDQVEEVSNSLKMKFKYSSFNPDLRNALSQLSAFAIVENAIFDAEKTLEARKNAGNDVEPVIIHAGDPIVLEGQVITNERYELLELVGLLTNKHNFYPYIGLGLLVLLLLGGLGKEWYQLKHRKELNKKTIISLLVISVGMLAIMKVVSLYTLEMEPLYFVVPAAAGAMLIKLLINERFAMVLSTIFTVLGCIIFNNDMPGSLNVEAGIYLLITQWAGIYFITNIRDRLALLKAGLGIAIVNIMIIAVFMLLGHEKYTIIDLVVYSGYGALSAFLASVLTIGLLPFFEAGLGMLSDAKLLTLSNPNHPLLRKILTEAPGTYHHSVMVANLSETACEAIGANGLLARVAAYYHDLGKTVKPHFFIENQIGIQNPHDFISPEESAQVIISHPYDGSEMLKSHRIPQEIVDIAEQHHGTGLLKYFYYKAKEKQPHVKEELYRYPGPKPQTREAAIVSICDSVEAAVRSLNQPSKDDIERVVESIISDRLKDGQLNESPLTLKELEMIKIAICETLQGIFHSRIQYPDSSKLVKEAK